MINPCRLELHSSIVAISNRFVKQSSVNWSDLRILRRQCPMTISSYRQIGWHFVQYLGDDVVGGLPFGVGVKTADDAMP